MPIILVMCLTLSNGAVLSATHSDARPGVALGAVRTVSSKFLTMGLSIASFVLRLS